MNTDLLDSQAWSRINFSDAKLGDVRRVRRLVKVASALADDPQGSLHGAMADWSDLIAAYRLVRQDKVTYEAVTEPHKRRIVEECHQPGEYLLVEDTTTLDFTTHWATEGLGRIGDDDGRGLFLHSTLALRIESWEPNGKPNVTALGLFGQECWARTSPTLGRGERKGDRLRRKRESERWGRAFEKRGGPPPGVRWTYTADRESDIYEVFQNCATKGVDWIVRANQPRALADADGSIFTAVAEAPCLGSFKLKTRARPGQKKRKVRLEVRAIPVTLRGPWRPGGWLPAAEMNVVEAREVDAPPDVEAIHWVLLTSWPIDSFEAALRVVKTYTRRWVIEEYHKALKTGAGVEESQLMNVDSLRTLIGVLAVVAVRLLNMKLLATAQPNVAVDSDRCGAEAITILERKFGVPDGGWTNQTFLVAVARVGGFLARKHDGNPGWISIWRGWHRLMLMVQGFLLAR